jgi:cell cycle checkpoint control protein RAD9A
MDEFDTVEVEDKLHIIISVKDFRAILQHAQMTSGALTATYSHPGRPMKLFYSTDVVLCEFILMTVGEKDALVQKHKNPQKNAAKAPAQAQQLDSASHRASSTAAENRSNPQPSAPRTTQNPPHNRPRQPAFEIRPSPMPAPTRARSPGLFVDQAEDDAAWEPVNPDEEEEEDESGRLGWNNTNEPVGASPHSDEKPADLKCQNPSSIRIGSYLARQAEAQPESQERLESGLEPTQRLSQVCDITLSLLLHC